MSKSTFLNNRMPDKSDIAFVCILGMMTGFLINQVVLSISMILFCINALRGVHPRQWLQNKWWLLGLTWLAMIGLSYFWSENKVNWERCFQVKFPLILFPLACGFMPAFSARQLQWVTLLMGCILTCGIGYSLYFLISDPAQHIWNYKISHLLPTPCNNDHIRFSIALALFFIWCVYIWPHFRAQWLKWTIAAILAVMVIYLHILAAKSGLVALYVFLISWSLYLTIAKRKLAGVAIIVAIPLFLLLAVKFIPTFRARKDSVYYAWAMLAEGDRSGHYGDIGRLMSYKLAGETILQHPWLGVGAGDMMASMQNGYNKYYPQIEENARLLPHNQFLIVAMASGIPAMLLFVVWVFYPLTWLRRNKGADSKTERAGRANFFFFIVWLLLLTQLLIEPVLEVQYGVFVYLFFLLWQRQRLPGVEGMRG
jgi:O-antigen ligase